VSWLPEPLRIPAFRYYWLARLTATIGQMAMVIVIGWQVYDIARHTMGLKEAALRLGIIGLVQFVPLFMLTLVTGWTADRVDRRWIARASVALELGCAAALALFAWTHSTTLLALYTVAALLGVARAFAGPALGALAPNLVPRKILPRAIALSSIAWQSGSIVGPAIGGYLYAYAPFAPYAGSALLFAVSLAGLFAIGPVKRPEIAKGPNPWEQMVEGLRYVRRNRLVLGTALLGEIGANSAETQEAAAFVEDGITGQRPVNILLARRANHHVRERKARGQVEAERLALLVGFPRVGVDRQQIGKRATKQGFGRALEIVGELAGHIGQSAKRIGFPEPAAAAVFEFRDEIEGFARLPLDSEPTATVRQSLARHRNAVGDDDQRQSANVTIGSDENNAVATIATSALIIASGGETIATIERTKKPLAMAKVMNPGSARPSALIATLEPIHSMPVVAI
jgi:hypothetical protein